MRIKLCQVSHTPYKMHISDLGPREAQTLSAASRASMPAPMPLPSNECFYAWADAGHSHLPFTSPHPNLHILRTLVLNMSKHIQPSPALTYCAKTESTYTT